MDDQKQQAIARIKQANNVLVTVRTNPSVDQLAACIGLTLILNKLGKHGAAVFSGAVPSTIEFLKPEETLEKNTDSLRDFIIALDKSKADKLRYKVEDKVVKIFITPYHTSLGEKDLEFSQGDFNIDAVVALGVREQSELDQAITAHGRILHDATVISINNTADKGSLGSISWHEANVSSLSELVTQLGLELDKTVLDTQISTALLTGIVAATERFSNEKTTSKTMSISAQLVTAGANPQLVATKLQESIPVEIPREKPAAPPPPPPPPPSPPPPPPPPPPPVTSVAKTEDGTLNIDHDGDPDGSEQIDIDKDGVIRTVTDQPSAGPGSKTTTAAPQPEPPTDADNDTGDTDNNEPEPPTTPPPPAPPEPSSSALTANSTPESLEGSTDPLSLPPAHAQLLDHEPKEDGVTSARLALPDEPENLDPDATNEPPVVVASPMLEDARNAVEAAVSSAPTEGALPPVAALNALPALEGMHASSTANDAPDTDAGTSSTLSHHNTINPPPADSLPGSNLASIPIETLNMPLPPNPFSVPDQPAIQSSPGANVASSSSDATNVFAPPPLPPPMTPTYDPGAVLPPTL